MLKPLNKWLIAAFLFIIVHSVQSDKLNYRFDRLTINDGLSSNTVIGLLLDSTGFLWGGGEYGLNRYDGNNVKIYSPYNCSGKMSEGWILSLCEDGDFIWIGTTKGLNLFDKRTEKFTLYTNDPLNDNSLSGDNVKKVLRTKDKEIWIATNNGLNRYNRSNNSFIRYKFSRSGENSSISSDFVQALFEDKLGNLWIGTNNGLDIMKKDGSEFIHYKNNPDSANSISDNNVVCIFEDSFGMIWISTSKGIDRFDRANNKFIKILDQRSSNSSWGSDIANITEDIYHNIWLASSSIGIHIYNPADKSFQYLLNNPNDGNSLTGNYVASMFMHNNTLWVGTSGSGLCSYNHRKWKFDHFKSIAGDSGSLSSPIVWSICEDSQRNIWAATNVGLNIYNRSSGYFSHKYHSNSDPSSISDNNIRYIYRDKKNDMWIVSIGYALEKYDQRTGGFIHYYDTNGRGYNGTFLTEDSKGNYWLGCWDGLRIFDKDMKLTANSLKLESGTENFSDKPILHIYEDRNKNIWISTLYGLYLLSDETGTLKKFTNESKDSGSVSSSSVCTVVQDKEGIIWITTYGGGLNRYDPKAKKFSYYYENDGLPHNVLYGIVEDNSGHLWMSSNKGISDFDPKSGIFTNYGPGDGVQGLEFASGSFYKSDYGDIYFGGINGFNRFNPMQMPRNNDVPEIALTSFKVFSAEAKLPVSINYTDEIELSYWDNFFSFEFASLDFTNPQNNKYRYKLEGVDKDWVNTGSERTASYTNISPGKYTFRVIGSNSDGIWNLEGKTVKITITPAWWQTLWLRVAAVFSLLLIAAVFIQRKYAGLKKEKEKKEEFTRQLILSQEQERKAIAHELHDSLVQDLLVVKNKASLAVRYHDLPDKYRITFRDISEGITGSMNMVREISHKLKPHEIERFGLTRSIEILAEKVNSSGSVNFTVKPVDIDKLLPENDEVNLFRIVQECINNILKHSDAENAHLKIIKDEKQITLVISDDGKGFDAEKLMKKEDKLTFGLGGIYERVSLMNGKVNIRSHEGSGTEIELIIPLTKI